MDDKLELSYNSGNSTNNKKKRCCICVFWDKQGIVRDYVTYYIKGLQKIAEKVIVTVNGIITDDSREKAEFRSRADMSEKEAEQINTAAKQQGEIKRVVNRQSSDHIGQEHAARHRFWF